MSMLRCLVLALLSLFVVLDFVRSQDDCTQAPVLNDVSWRSPDKAIWAHNAPTLNDYGLSPGWYRAVHNGEQYLMAPKSADLTVGKCGTAYPIYMADAHPELDDITENGINATACMGDFMMACDTKHDIQLRKCGSEIQYNLQSTGLYAAYCFEPSKQVGVKRVAAPNVKIGTLTVKPQLFFENKMSPLGSVSEASLRFYCQFARAKKYFYSVNWYADGKHVIKLGPSTPDDDEALSLKEDTMLKNNAVKLGCMISCSATVAKAVNGSETLPEFSKEFFAGAKIVERTVFMKRKQSANITVKLTVPIGCSMADMIRRSGRSDEICSTSLEIVDVANNGLSCSNKGGIRNAVSQGNAISQGNKCTNEEIKTLQQGQTFDADTEFNFAVVTSDMTYDDNSVFNLRLAFHNTTHHKIWKGYTLPTVRVIVEDNDDHKDKICYSHIDPHMRTADQRYYEQQQEGEFILYNNKKYNIEVQEKTAKCNNDRATCTCGLIVRAGCDIFMINRCGKLNFIDFIRCEEGGILDVVQVNDMQYTVFTPIGTRIAIKLYNYWGSAMNIDIYMAPKDFGNTEGLCGNFDGDITNDLQHRDGSVTNANNNYQHHKDFVNSWRMDETESLFCNCKRNIPRWGEENELYCACGENGEAVCSPSQNLNCTYDKSITDMKCHKTIGRRKRSASRRTQEKELARLFKQMEKPRSENKMERRILKRREANVQEITREEANDMCTKKINGSLAICEYGGLIGSENPDSVIQQCAFDVFIGNERSWAETHVESVNNIVKNIIALKPVFAKNNTEEVETFMQNTCPLNCSNRGNCSKEGECTCEQFYHGSDCSIDERDPIEIDDIEGGGECDLQEGDECRCFTVRAADILPKVTCNVTTYKVSINATYSEVSNSIEKGLYEDIFTTVCCANQSIYDINDRFYLKYEFSVSNDGVNFGDAVSMVVFDSKCQEEVRNGEDIMHLIQKPDTCFIGDMCYVRTEPSPTDIGLVCYPSFDIYNWTVDCGLPSNGDGISIGYVVPDDLGHGQNTVVGSNATYTCLPGFELDRHGTLLSTVECLVTGEWEALPMCMRKDCGSLQEVNTTTTRYIEPKEHQSTLFNSTASYRCSTGYDVDGQGIDEIQIRCKEDGTWEKIQFCKIKDCGPVPGVTTTTSFLEMPLSGKQHTVYNSAATYRCIPGYETDDGLASTSILCKDDGMWEQPSGCFVKDCGPFPTGDGKTIQLLEQIQDDTPTVYGSTIEYKCLTGFQLDNSDADRVNISCNEEGRWEMLPTCMVKQCWDFPQIDLKTTRYIVNPNGQQRHIYNSTIMYECLPGYQLDKQGRNKSEIACTAAGEWGTLEQCFIKDCGRPPAIEDRFMVNLNTASQSTLYNSTLMYECLHGYQLDDTGMDSISILCTEDGVWEDLPACGIKDCGPAPSVENHFITNLSGDNQTTVFNSTAIYQCLPGYQLDDSGLDIVSIACTEDGDWEDLPICRIKDCGSVPSADDHFMRSMTGENQTTVFNSTALYQCLPGYQLDDSGLDSVSVTCNEDGIWDELSVCIIKDCGPAPSVDNHFITNLFGENQTTVFNSTAVYQCLPGYQLDDSGLGIVSIACTEDGEWEDLPVCRIKDCGPAPSVDNHFITNLFGENQTTVFNSTAVYQCLPGYQLDDSGLGIVSIACTEHGEWEDLPVCRIKDCGSVPSAEDHFMRSMSGEDQTTVFNSTALYQCLPGYQLDNSGLDSVSVTCNEDGIWDELSVCIIKDCGPAPSVDNHFITNLFGENQTTVFNSTAVYQCLPGYQLDDSGLGIVSIACTEDGEWEDLPVCRIKDCGPAPSVDNHFITNLFGENQITVFNSTAVYQCLPGYQLDDSGLGIVSIACTEDGEWEDLPVCRIKDCGSVPTAEDHFMRTITGENQTTLFNSTAVYQCLPGYQLDDSGLAIVSIRCTEDGEWKDLPVCRIKDCGSVPSADDHFMRNMSDENQATVFNSTALYQCLPGYQLDNSGLDSVSVTCNEDGIWDELSVCIIKDCGPAPSVDNHFITNLFGENQTTVFNSTAVYQCLPGYQLDDSGLGIVSIACTEDGEWEDLPVCRIKDCGPAPSVDNHFITNLFGENQTTVFNSTAVYQCLPGYQLDDSGLAIVSIACTEDGEWEDLSVCRIKDCGSVPSAEDHFMRTMSGENQTTVFNSTALYQCLPGYQLDDSGLAIVSIRCTEDGEWEDLPVCGIKDCGPVVSFEDHFMTNMPGGNQTTVFNSTVVYQCLPGYQLDDSGLTIVSITCTEDGVWQELPVCTIKDCGPVPAEDGLFLTFIPSANQSTLYNSTATYRCHTGYQLDDTSSDTVTVSCTENSTWEELPVCKIKDCGPVPSEDGSFLTYIPSVNQSTVYMSSATYKCSAGYQLKHNGLDTVSISCNENATWENLPTCTIKDCGPVPSEDGLFMTFIPSANQSTVYNSKAMYRCRTGYQLDDGTETAAIRCTEQGDWEELFNCRIKDCGPIPEAEDHQMTYTVPVEQPTVYTSIAVYSCLPGYELLGSEDNTMSIMCTENGTWEYIRNCTIKDCGPVPSFDVETMDLVTNGGRDSLPTVYNNTVTYQCLPGYIYDTISEENSVTVKCTEFGIWEEFRPTCLDALETIPQDFDSTTTMETTETAAMTTSDVTLDTIPTTERTPMKSEVTTEAPPESPENISPQTVTTSYTSTTKKTPAVRLNIIKTRLQGVAPRLTQVRNTLTDIRRRHKEILQNPSAQPAMKDKQIMRLKSRLLQQQIKKFNIQLRLFQLQMRLIKVHQQVLAKAMRNSSGKGGDGGFEQTDGIIQMQQQLLELQMNQLQQQQMLFHLQ